jgi:tetratricopeptide (TPR) repeat protein
MTCALVVAVWLAPALGRADDDNTEAAKIHYKAGEQYYVRGLYSQAIAEFKEAYRLSKASALLFNMSQAYERMGDLKNARDSLKQYIDSGETEPGELPALQEKLATLDKRIAEPEPNAVSVVPPVEEDSGPSRPLKTWKWVTGGVGVGLVALSVLFMLDGNAQEQKLEDLLMEHPEFSGEPQDIYNRGQRANRLAVGFGIGGVALVATSAVFFWLDAKHARAGEASSTGTGTARALVPIVGPGVAGAAAVITF